MCLFAASTVFAQQREVVDRIVAVIDDDMVTLQELQEKAKPFMGQINTIENLKEREKRRTALLRQVLDIEIGERIVSKEVEKNKDKLAVSTSEVDRMIDQVMQDNKLTREQLQSALYSQGITWSEYRKKIREQLERTRLIQSQVQGKIQIKEADVRRRCQERQGVAAGGEEVCAAHILFEIPKGATSEETAAIKARAVKLQAELTSGADFSSYALKYSDDKSAADGSIGCFSRGEMVDAFEKAAFAAKVGDITPVVQTEFGFHIIKVTDRRSAATPCDSENALTPFYNELYQAQVEQQMQTWVQQLRSKAFIDVRL
ncbi:MAG: peptidylprolyl isomerase [Myxococcota bacterium]